MKSRNLPFNPEALFQRALGFHNKGDLNEAEKLYTTLLDYFPRQPELLSAFGTLLLQQEKQSEGMKLLERSLSISPNQPMVLYNLGVELQKLCRLEDAMACYDRAITLNPRDEDSYLNLGNTLKDLKRYVDAAVCYDKAIVLNPNLASAHWNKSLLKILTGEYEEGWRLYEWGWKASERGALRKFTQPLWLGEQPIAGKTILIHAEQGLGDTIQFCRYIPMVAALGAKVILEVQKPLVALLSTLQDNITVIEKGLPLPDFDFYCPIMSLPLAFKTTVATIPASVPYLHSEEGRQKGWRLRLDRKAKPRIGLAWSGSLTNKIDLNPCSRRNIPLQALAPLLQLPLEFHVLQKDIRPEDAVLLQQYPQLSLHQNDLNDFSDTAALVEEMDLVISVCTSTAHLAGALAKPFWVLLPFTPDYRWMAEGAESAWYPTATIFRQSAIGNWSSVVTAIVRQIQTTIIQPAVI